MSHAMAPLLLLALAAVPDGGSPEDLCSLGARRACDFEARCVVDPHRDPEPRADCLGRFEHEQCGGGDAGWLQLEPPARAGVLRCLEALYPSLGCERDLTAIDRACSAERHQPPPDAGPPATLPDAGTPEVPDAGSPAPEVEHPYFFPLQGSAAMVGELGGGGTTFGGNFYLGWAFGRVIRTDAFADKEGPFLGIGLAAEVAYTDIPGCARAVRCANRVWGGTGFRLGWALWSHRKLSDRLDQKPGNNAGRVVWPDNYFYVQVTPFFGAEHIDSAPLAPAETSLLRGARVDLGVNSVELSRTLFWVLGELLTRSGGPRNDAAVGVLLFVPLALLNHLEFNVEWSNPALSPGGWRAGVSMGSGF